MIISATAFSVLVTVALVITVAALFVFLALFLRDRSKGQIW